MVHCYAYVVSYLHKEVPIYGVTVKAGSAPASKVPLLPMPMAQHICDRILENLPSTHKRQTK